MSLAARVLHKIGYKIIRKYDGELVTYTSEAIFLERRMNLKRSRGLTTLRICKLSQYAPRLDRIYRYTEEAYKGDHLIPPPHEAV